MDNDGAAVLGSKRLRRRNLVATAHQLADDQDGVASRRQLYELGLNKDLVRAEVRARRWRTHGRYTIAVHTTELTERATWRRAVWEVGSGAALDGVTALIAAGLERYKEDLVHASVCHGTDPNRPDGVRVHESRMRTASDVVTAGIPRVRPAIATVRGALWAVSDRQAALVVVMAVQQRVARAVDVAAELAKVKRHRRRKFLTVIVRDVLDGAQALGELDFARLCRERGLPPPSRQVVREGRRGRFYLDVYWDALGIVVEIEGIHHGSGGLRSMTPCGRTA